MPSTEPSVRYDAKQRALLLKIAEASIAHGLARGEPSDPRPSDYPQTLREIRASFVTLEIGHALRGCIGVLEAYRPLVADVAQNAFAAAFSDPRFPPVRGDELAHLRIKLSILSPAEPLHFESESDLLRQIRPGIDGLILQDQGHRGTFLPSVWEQLPEPSDFLRHLKHKAGLAMNHWSDSLRVLRYTTESFGGTDTSSV